MSSAYSKFEGHVNHQNNFEVKIMVRTRIEVFLASSITNVGSNDNVMEAVPTPGKPMSIHSLHKLQFIRKWVRKPILEEIRGTKRFSNKIIIYIRKSLATGMEAFWGY